MERLKRMSVFAKVVEFGSFTAAARQLQMSVSSISQTVAKLEDELQVKLLNRSTRSIGLTEAGKIYYQGCRRMLHEVQDVHEQLYAFNNTPIGTLRIGCSSTMAQNVLAGLTAKMLKEYPGLTVNPGYSLSISAVMAARTFCAIVEEHPMRSVPMGVLLKA